ncbi:hypothetical protein ABIB51_002352 [Arthrobacter sp. UYCu712]
MRAVQVGHGGIRLCEFDEQPEEGLEADAVAAVLRGHPQPAEAFLVQPADLLERQGAVLLAGERALGDPGKHGPEALRELLIFGFSRKRFSRKGGGGGDCGVWGVGHTFPRFLSAGLI